MFTNLQKCTNENALLKEKIRDFTTETEARKMFIKEELYLLKKAQKDKMIKRNTDIKLQNLRNFFVSKTLLYFRKIRLKIIS